MELDNEFVVWALVQTRYEWIEWIKVGSGINLKEAQTIGKNCQSRCWGIRKRDEPTPRYISGDDGRWVGGKDS